MKTWPLFRGMLGIQLTAWVQRALRLLLRAAWLLAGLYLAGQSLEKITGRPLVPVIYAISFLVVSIITLGAILFPWPRFGPLAWKMDQRMGLKEQVTTALQAAISRQPSALAQPLIDDASRLLPSANLKVFLRGWSLSADIAATGLIAILYGMGAAAGVIPAVILPDVTASPQVPALSQELRAYQLFPSGIPGLTTPKQVVVPNQAPPTDAQLQEMYAEFRELGKNLNGQPLTQELGLALQQGNLSEAALQMSSLAGLLPSLDRTSLDEISKEFGKASDALEKTGIQPLADDFFDVHAQIENGRSGKPQSALSDLAEDMRALSNQIAPAANLDSSTSSDGGGGNGASISTSQRQTGSGESFSRLTGEGQTLELKPQDGGQGTIQAGAGNSSEGLPPAGSSVDANQLQIIDGGESWLTPYTYPWERRDVLKEYFSR